MPETIIEEQDLLLERYGNIFVLTMRKAPENRINSQYAQRLIAAYNTVRKLLGEDAEGAVITKGNDAKFWCTVCWCIPPLISVTYVDTRDWN
jgi:hypothetical protein